MSSRTRLMLASALVALTSASAHAQTFFTEQFENMGNVPIGGWGPQGLINKGWIFQNNSVPLGTIGWVPGCCWGSVIAPLSGTGYLASYQDSAAGGSPTYSNWAIIQAIPDQQAGDVFGFYTISSDTSPFDNVSLEVRYSPSGGTNVGSTATSVGDFTTVLLDIATMPNMNEGTANGWTYWEFTLPGDGRIALRQTGDSSLYFGIEDISVSHPVVETNFPEDFENLGGICGEGPCALVDNGWVFKDQSTPSTGAAWEPNQPLDQVQAHDGFGFMKSVSVAGGGASSGGMNTWAILPDEGIGTNDVLAFFATGQLAIDDEVGTLEVRYSPTGSTNTGSGVNGVGDFTQVLASVTDLVNGSWQLVSVTVPGDGRVAIRFHNAQIPAFSGIRSAAIDSMTVNEAPIGPPLPQPGETVTWTAAMSPITIDGDLAIAAGGTLVVEAGVTINLTTDSTLSVAGEFVVNGSAESHVTINGWAPDFPAILDAGGHSEFTFVDMHDGRFEPTFATSCTATDSVVSARSVVGCTFTDAGVSVVDDVLSVKDSTFTGGGISLLRGYFHVDNVSIDGGAISLSREDAAHTAWINHVSITNSVGPALTLGGFTFALGADNLIANNLYPVQLSGGLARGSVVPSSGNVNDFVHLQNDSSPTGFDELPALAVPYLLSSIYLPGLGLEVEPGARFVGLPGAQLWDQFHQMRLLGTPEQPINFEGMTRAPAAWHGIQWSIADGSRMEYCIVKDAQFAALVDESIVPIDNCTFDGNVYGSRTTTFGISYLRKNQFLGNQFGISGSATGSFDANGQTNPNAIVGNDFGAGDDDPSDSPDARFNWWGSPSGPSTPDNPRGQGDSAAANVQVIPFLTAAPNFADTPPVVRLQEMARVWETNAPIILHWEASDDGAIVSQRVLFSELGTLDDVQVLHELPGSQRSALVTVPESTFFHRGYFIVQAIDDLGQIGHDERFAPIALDPNSLPGSFTFPRWMAGPFETGEDIEAFPYVVGNDYAIMLDDMNEGIGLGAGVLTIDAPYHSTDSARFFAVDINGKRYFSESFTVRPPSYVGDAAPTVDITAPSGGSFAGGTTVNLAWSAADDEAIRGFDVQASYDGGRAWHFIRKALPASTTQFAWTIAPLDRSLSDVRVRVVAWDLRFQSSSDTVALSLLPGSGGIVGDINGSGAVDAADLALLLGAWGPCGGGACPADLNGDGAVDAADLAMLLGAWS